MAFSTLTNDRRNELLLNTGTHLNGNNININNDNNNGNEGGGGMNDRHVEMSPKTSILSSNELKSNHLSMNFFTTHSTQVECHLNALLILVFYCTQ